ncbi:hypothetical protein P4S72_26020 [Vibrio sp. PP-XX7]
MVFRYEPYFQQGKDNIGVESDVIIATFNETGKNAVISAAQIQKCPGCPNIYS